MKSRVLTAFLAAALLMAICSVSYAASAVSATNALNDETQLYPPWERGEMKNPATFKGEEWKIPEANIVSDLHGNPTTAEFVIYSFGHYYFLLGEFVKEFMQQNPNLQGKVYYQTIPLGVNRGMLEQDYTITMGNLTLRIQPDVMMGGQSPLEDLLEEGELEGPIVPYMTTRLGIMVKKGNPKNIQTWSDLAEPGIRLYMPNPETSGTAQQGVTAMEKEGGEELVDVIYEEKRERGETTIVKLHHRETPIGLMKGEIDAGLTWATEAIYQARIGNPITVVIPPPEYNVQGVFSAAKVRNARHPQTADAWLRYLRSPSAQALIRDYQFGVYTGAQQASDLSGTDVAAEVNF